MSTPRKISTVTTVLFRPESQPYPLYGRFNHRDSRVDGLTAPEEVGANGRQLRGPGHVALHGSYLVHGERMWARLTLG